MTVYRRDPAARRALVLLHLGEGSSYREIQAAAFVGPNLIATVKRDLAAGGVARALGLKPASCVVPSWWLVVARWRWNRSAAIVAILLAGFRQSLIYVGTMRERMDRRGFNPADRLYWQTAKAYDALHELSCEAMSVLGGSVKAEALMRPRLHRAPN